MNTNFSHAGTSPRLRLFSAAEASAAGTNDAKALLAAIGNAEEGDAPANLLSDSLSEIIGLAVENRLDECEARKGAFCAVIGPALAGKKYGAAPHLTNITDSEGGEL